MRPETVSAYEALLSDLNEDDVLAAVHEHAMSETGPPTVAHIRRRIFERTLALPSVPEAVEALNRTTHSENARETLHPLVYEARRAVGDSWAWRTSKESGIMVAQARKLYEELRERRVRDAMSRRALEPLRAAR